MWVNILNDVQELQMDQQAKKHLQDEFDAALEEKDQMITVLQTQVSVGTWMWFFMCDSSCSSSFYKPAKCDFWWRLTLKQLLI